MERTAELSVIIPFRDVSTTIERCVNSLFEQTVAQSIEYIFIDDASIDDSRQKIEKLLSLRNELKSRCTFIVHTQNEGVANSRQEGIEKAIGKFIIFCDADDYIEKDFYRQLLEEARRGDFDIVTSGFIFHTKGKTSKKDNSIPPPYSAPGLLGQIAGSSKEAMQGSLWDKLINREVALKACFLPDIDYQEDVAYLFQILEDTNLKVSHLNITDYHYIFSPTSLSALRSKKKLENIIRLIQWFVQTANFSENEAYRKACMAKVAWLIYIFSADTLLIRKDISIWHTKLTKTVSTDLLKMSLQSNRQLSTVQKTIVRTFYKGSFLKGKILLFYRRVVLSVLNR